MGQNQIRENVRAVMILNEVEVAVAQILVKNEAFTPIQDRLQEVRQIILDQTFNETQES
jgi:hypothetical protein